MPVCCRGTAGAGRGLARGLLPCSWLCEMHEWDMITMGGIGVTCLQTRSVNTHQAAELLLRCTCPKLRSITAVCRDQATTPLSSSTN